MAQSSKQAKPNNAAPHDGGATSNPMWGGHYASGPDALMEHINASIHFDRKLYRQDIAGSLAHVAMLEKQEIISEADAEAIREGLEQIREEITQGVLTVDPALEDIHMHIEARLRELIGDAAGRLHTARSRNDQVATDLKLYVRDAIDHLDLLLQDLQEALIDKAVDHAGSIMPGFTHLQTAQPVTLGHHLLAYVEMVGRDRSRLRDCRARLNECPLGAAALAGTSFPIDRRMTAELLGFDRPTANSLDSVSDRDYAIEFMSGAALCIMHLSRFAEELVMWASAQFGFITLSEGFTTGSSIMPQKRNPDAAELIRAKSGRIYGDLFSLLTVMKGLPLTYSKDMQEDKEPVFDVVDTLPLCIEAMTGMVRDMTIHTDVMARAAEYGFSTATDIADWLVQHLDIPFRKAHHITGRIVRLAESQQCLLGELSLEALQSVEPGITDALQTRLTPTFSAASRTSEGGTAPDNVIKAALDARRRFLT